MAEIEYYCDCPRYCKARKKVSERTYRRHTKERLQIAASINEYLGLAQTEAHPFFPPAVPPPNDNDNEVGDPPPPPQGNSQDTDMFYDDLDLRNLYNEFGGGGGGESYGRDEPEVDEPEVHEPEVHEPEVHEPEVDKPEVHEPEVDEPEVHEPEVDEPEPDPGSIADNRGVRPPQGSQETSDYDPGDVTLEETKTTLEFINLIRNATLDNSNLDPDTIYRLRNPEEGPPDISDPYLLLAIKIFIATSNASQDTYTDVKDAISECFPDCHFLSYDQVKRRISHITGISPLVYDMCINSCVAYTGPYATLTRCPRCNTFRYDPIRYNTSRGEIKIPQQTFDTIPVGPQLQSLWRNKESALALRYRVTRTREILQELPGNANQIPIYDDFLSGSEYLSAFRREEIGEHDMTLLLSLDGAQLYEKKLSDCWIYIWLILDFPPDLRYKKKAVFFGGIIPGPHKPKHFDSFLFPGFHHLSALQRDGLRIWDAYDGVVYTSRPFFTIGAADGPGVIYLNGLTGHHGYYSCRLYCPMKGRRAPGDKTHYPVHLKPDNYDVDGCNHEDFNFDRLPVRPAQEYQTNLAYVVASRSMAEYDRRRKETGIVKPSLLSGLHRSLSIPGCCGLDLMHLISLNITELFLLLWRGSMKCRAPDDKSTWDWAVLQDDVWETHGKNVADTTPYLPGSFDVPPRNPAERISSGYKAREFLTYIFILGPGLLYGILPEPYFTNFCKLVYAIRIIQQRRITREGVIDAHRLLVAFVREFEEIYYQRKVERIHFCRPSIHTLLHLAREVIRLGPGCYYSQWTMERTIGNITEEMKQPSRPYANLSRRGIRRTQVNALKAMIPELDRKVEDPRGSQQVSDGYVLLRAKDEAMHTVQGVAGAAIKAYMQRETGQIAPNWQPRVHRWARLRIPTGQIVRSAWKEKLKPLEKVRMSRNVKFVVQDTLHYGEAQFFFQAKIHNQTRTLALVSTYSPPNPTILRESYNTVWATRYQGAEGLEVIDAKAILSVVCLAPLPARNGYFFVGEKLGLEVTTLDGLEEEPGA